MAEEQHDWETEIERSASGQPIHRYEMRSRDFELATGDGSLIDAVDNHIEKHLGESNWVLHELISDLIHVDIHVVPPTEARPFYVLVTSGMAERPMQQPEGVEGCQFAELFVCLPPDWPGLEQSGGPIDDNHPFADEANYWPIRWLKMLSRFPHEYETWIWSGHTIPNGDPPEPLAPNTGFSSILLLGSLYLPDDFMELRVGDRDVNFFALWPLYPAELQLKLDEGTEALIERFEAAGVTELIDIHRPSAVEGRGKPWWKFW